MIVVDTNIISYLFLSGERSEQSEHLLSANAHWAAPLLWRSEFRSVLGQYLRKKLLDFRQCLEIVHQAEALMTSREYQVSSTQVMKLLSTSACSAYDCEFVALAKDLDRPLITEDKKILSIFPKIARSVEDYLNEPHRDPDLKAKK